MRAKWVRGSTTRERGILIELLSIVLGLLKISLKVMLKILCLRLYLKAQLKYPFLL